jgi:hypothetical protein
MVVVVVVAIIGAWSSIELGWVV